MRTVRPASQAAAVALALFAPAAHAHLVETGFGAFYDGIAHVLLTPADLLVVMGLALLAGQRGVQASRWALFALPIAWLVGGLLGTFLTSASTWPLLTTLTFAVAGALAAFNVRLASSAVALLAVAAGLIHGVVNGATMVDGRALALFGAAVATFCAFAILASQITAVRAAWGRIAVRVGGSWIAAAGLLMLGWLVRA